MTNPGFADNPAALLEDYFNAAHQGEMADLRLNNENVQVEAVGFHLYENHWLGVMVTPWFLNLMLLPQKDQPWPALNEGKSVVLQFPCGNLKFIARDDKTLGSHLVCSLASPVRDYKTQEEIVQVAQDVLRDLNKIPVANVDEPASMNRRQLFTNLTAG